MNANDILKYVLIALGLLAIPIALFLSRYASKAMNAIAAKVTAETKAGLAQSAILRILHFGDVATQRMLGRLAPQFRAALADGELSKEERTELKNAALAELKAILVEEGKEELLGFLGIASGAVDGYLEGIIEKSINEAKTTVAASTPVIEAEAAPSVP